MATAKTTKPAKPTPYKPAKYEEWSSSNLSSPAWDGSTGVSDAMVWSGVIVAANDSDSGIFLPCHVKVGRERKFDKREQIGANGDPVNPLGEKQRTFTLDYTSRPGKYWDDWMRALDTIICPPSKTAPIGWFRIDSLHLAQAQIRAAQFMKSEIEQQGQLHQITLTLYEYAAPKPAKKTTTKPKPAPSAASTTIKAPIIYNWDDYRAARDADVAKKSFG